MTRKQELPAWWRRFAGYPRWAVDGTCGAESSHWFREYGWWPGQEKPWRMKLEESVNEVYAAIMVEQVTKALWCKHPIPPMAYTWEVDE